MPHLCTPCELSHLSGAAAVQSVERLISLFSCLPRLPSVFITLFLPSLLLL